MTETTALATVPVPPAILEAMKEERFLQVLMTGDLAGLSLKEKGAYCYWMAVKRGYEPMSKPFDLITVQGRTFLYANKSAAAQEKRRNGWRAVIKYQGLLRLKWESRILVSVDGKQFVERVPVEFDSNVYEVEVDIVDAEGKVLETEVGTCEWAQDMALKDKKDAPMKAYTRAKRRGILSAAGAGENDESEFSEGPAVRAANSGFSGPRRVAAPVPVEAQIQTASGDIIDGSTGEVLEESVRPEPAGPVALPRKVPPAKPPVV